MKVLKIISDNDIFKKVEFRKPKEYQVRKTVKGIIKNKKNNKFAFVTNDIHKCILLAGGGVKSDDLEKEIQRECLEELSYSIKNIKKIFKIKEFRNRKEKEYETFCFYGEINKKEKGDLRTEKERQNNLKVIWLEEKEALDKMEKQMLNLKERNMGFYNTSFNILRDYYFFKEFLKLKNLKKNFR